METDSFTATGRRLVILVYLLFFLSGFCGLVYEIIWMRQFAVSFGNTIFAITVVLAAFMGGLAAGSRWFGLLADSPGRKASLFTYYGWMEIFIGIYCLGFERILEAQKRIILWFYHTLDPSTAASVGFNFLLSALLLIVPTILMGGTLPVLIKALSRRLPDVGRITGKLYFVNCFGAVFGTITVAFWMIPSLGLALSTALAAAVNIAVGLVALGLRGRIPEPTGLTEETATARDESIPAAVPQAVLRWSLIGIFICGFTAMVYEITWTRILSLVLGSSTYSFSLMLAAFISGIALGSFLISRFMERINRPAYIFALCQIAVGLAVLAMLPLYSHLPIFFIRCRELVNFSYEAHEVFKFIVCLGVMLVPTTAIGMGFPLVSRLAATEMDKTASKVGGVYALNTMGNILGTVLCGFVMIPMLGLKITLETAVLFNLTAGGAILLSLGSRRASQTIKVCVLGTLAVAMYFLLAPGWDRQILTGGAFRYRPSPGATAENFSKRVRSRDLLFYREGISTTVTVEQSDSNLMLRVNGKVDASNRLDMQTQILLAHLPMLLHENPARVLVIGAGSGVTCGAVLTHPELESLYCVEISPGVVEASRFFAEYNRRYWEDPRTEIVVDDGRNFLFRSKEKWDVITSEPSNPWIAGIGSLYTEEFYSNCRERMAPGGIICQWIHLYEMEKSVLKTILITFRKAFPHAIAFGSIEDIDLLLIGSEEKLSVDFEALARRMKYDGVAAGLKKIGISSLFAMLSTQIFDTRGMQRWAGIGPINSDNFPVVEYRAPRGFFHASRVSLPDRYRLGEGNTLLANYLQIHEPTADELLEVARFQIHAGITSMVYSAVADALEIQPDHPDALRLMVHLLTGRKKFSEAAEVIGRLEAARAPEKELLELEYPVATALAERVSASFLRKPDFSRALEIKRRLIELESERSIHHYHLGETYERMRKYREAAQAFEVTLELRLREQRSETPEPQLIIHKIGNSYLEAQDFERASYWYERMCQEYPDEPLGPDMLRLVNIERLSAEGGTSDAEKLRRALEIYNKE